MEAVLNVFFMFTTLISLSRLIEWVLVQIFRRKLQLNDTAPPLPVNDSNYRTSPPFTFKRTRL